MSVRLHLITSLSEIKSLMAQDDIYKGILHTDDMRCWIPDTYYSKWFLVTKNNTSIGLFVIKDFSNNCISVHGGTFKSARHKDTAKVFSDCLKIINPKKEISIVTTVHENNKPAQKFVKRAGFTLKTTIKKGFKTGDLLLYELEE